MLYPDWFEELERLIEEYGRACREVGYMRGSGLSGYTINVETYRGDRILAHLQGAKDEALEEQRKHTVYEPCNGCRVWMIPINHKRLHDELSALAKERGINGLVEFEAAFRHGTHVHRVRGYTHGEDDYLPAFLDEVPTTKLHPIIYAPIRNPDGEPRRFGEAVS